MVSLKKNSLPLGLARHWGWLGAGAGSAQELVLGCLAPAGAGFQLVQNLGGFGGLGRPGWGWFSAGADPVGLRLVLIRGR